MNVFVPGRIVRRGLWFVRRFILRLFLFLRALVFDDDSKIRALLKEVLEERGYEVFEFPTPALCPLYQRPLCECPLDRQCADLIISDVAMPDVTGIEFIEAQLRKGCRVEHIALMSGDWSEAEIMLAKRRGCMVFHKPFTLDEIEAWLDSCEYEIDPERELSDWMPETKKNESNEGDNA